jgi:hypothetical protein
MQFNFYNHQVSQQGNHRPNHRPNYQGSHQVSPVLTRALALLANTTTMEFMTVFHARQGSTIRGKEPLLATIAVRARLQMQSDPLVGGSAFRATMENSPFLALQLALHANQGTTRQQIHQRLRAKSALPADMQR